jgi:hypothetical protein
MRLGRFGPVGTGRFVFSLEPLSLQEREELAIVGIAPGGRGLTRKVRRLEAVARSLSDEELESRIRELAERVLGEWKESRDPGLDILLRRAAQLLPDISLPGEG